MKTRKQQSLTPIIQVIIIVLGMLGGYYYFFGSFKIPQQSAQNQVNQFDVKNWQTYTNEKNKYTIQYPAQFVELKNDAQTEFGTLVGSIKLAKSKLLVTKNLAEGKNLSTDSGLIIEVYDNKNLCNETYVPEDFKKEANQTINNISYSVLSSTGAAAGNRYDQKIYRTVAHNKCYALVENIHSTNIANYEPGTVKAYDAQTLAKVFSGMVESFKVNQ